MFRVPTDATSPTFDQTEKIGFFRWLASSKADRVEWARRRNAAAEAARQGQNARVEERIARAGERIDQSWIGRRAAEKQARKEGR